MIELAEYSELDEIRGLFKQIDILQAQVLQKTRLISGSGHTTSEDRPVEFSREATAKAATVLIQKISDLVCVVQLKTSQLPEQSIADHFLQETLELYQGKIKHLRRRLKESQLAAYAEENANLHEKRLQEYCPEKIEHGADSEKSVDAREALFAGRSTKHEDGKDKNKSIGEQILTQNKNITSSLQHSKQLMTMSVMQTELNIDTLDQQSKDLTQLNEKLIDMEAVLGKSKQIVKFIERQDKQDKRRIYAAIGFLLLCSAWVLWRRVLKMPVKLLLWSLLKVFGVLNWATSVTKRDYTTDKQPADIFTATATLLENLSTTEFIAVPRKEEEPKETDSYSRSLLRSSVTETMSSSSEPSLTMVSTGANSDSIFEEPGDFTGTFIQDIINEQTVLTWEGMVSDPTKVSEPSFVKDEAEVISNDAFQHDENPDFNGQKIESGDAHNLNEEFLAAQGRSENFDEAFESDSVKKEDTTESFHGGDQKQTASSGDCDTRPDDIHDLASEEYSLTHSIHENEDRAGDKASEQEPNNNASLEPQPFQETDETIDFEKSGGINDLNEDEVHGSHDPGLILSEPFDKVSDYSIQNGDAPLETASEQNQQLQEGAQNAPSQNQIARNEVQQEVHHDSAESVEIKEKEDSSTKFENEHDDSIEWREGDHPRAVQLINDSMPEQEHGKPLEIDVGKKGETWIGKNPKDPIQRNEHVHDEL